MSFVRDEHSLVHDLIVFYHHCTVYYETVTGEEILKSNVTSLLTCKFPCATNSAFKNDDSRTT